MQKYLILCVLVFGCSSADEKLEEDDVQQVQQFAKSVKGGLPGGFQYNPGANLAHLFNHSQTGQQGTQRSWNENQGSWNQYQQNQASWNQSQQSWNQQNQNWNQAQSGWNQSWNQVHGQGQAGQGQAGWNQGQSSQGQAGQGQTGWNQGQTSQGQAGQGQTGWNQGQSSQGQAGQGQNGWNQGQNSQGNGWNQVLQRGNGTFVGQNTTGPLDLELGVCYIEVPTARLVTDPQHVPAGNGSRPDLSLIRSCCQGYIRNIHNFRKCDPVCSQECVNALCTAPETCTCFPDHIKNLAGFCIPTCPIGCQNGICEGNKCTCKPGFKLSVDSKFCVPQCTLNCGGLGNCTAPDTCECKPGYHSTRDGSCMPHCDKCDNGDCTSFNVCQCHQGFAKDKEGNCISLCGPGFQSTNQGCKPICDKCTNGDCVGPSNCQCHPGYVKQNGLCAPSCTPDCGPSSRCISPNVCDPPRQIPDQIYPGRIYPNLPQPSSDDLHGNPNAPGGQCSPSQSCLNGACVENRCQCNTGYVIDRSEPSGTKCIPHCPGGCTNGVCSAPNFCICNMGYVKDHSVKGRPSCVKRVRRSADQIPETDEKKPINVAELLIFDIPDYN